MKLLLPDRASDILIFFLLCLLALQVAGCATPEWRTAIEKSGDLAWPSEPLPAKVRYEGEITQFMQTGKSLMTMLTGKSQSGKIIKPVAITISQKGVIAIADQGREGVHFFNPLKKSYRFIYGAGDDIITSPVGVAIDDADYLYVTESLLGKILIFDQEGSFLKSIGEAGGTPLLRPSGIVYNQQDSRLYVADAKRHEILVFSRLGEFITSYGKRGEQPGGLNFPTHMGSDPQGKIYVTDSMNFRAQMLDPSSETWRTFGKQGNGSGDFASPKGIATDKAGFIYIAEMLFDNVQIFNNSGDYMLTIGSQGSGPGEFWMPSGIFIDDDRLYVCDTYNRRIQIFRLLTGETPPEIQTGKGKGS